MLPIYLLNHALRVNQLSVFDEDQRYQQTKETLDSIDKYASGLVFMFDSSPTMPNEKYVDEMRDRGVNWFYCGDIPDVNKFSLMGLRSVAETISMMAVLQYMRGFLTRINRPARIVKLSGRYSLNENFDIKNPNFVDKFVFPHAIDSWMDHRKQHHAGVSKLYKLRLWHMDLTCLDTFMQALPSVLDDCLNLGIDIEHAYYKHLPIEMVTTVDKVGVQGYIAPSGEFVNE